MTSQVARRTLTTNKKLKKGQGGQRGQEIQFKVYSMTKQKSRHSIDYELEIQSENKSNAGPKKCKNTGQDAEREEKNHLSTLMK